MPSPPIQERYAKNLKGIRLLSPVRAAVALRPCFEIPKDTAQNSWNEAYHQLVFGSQGCNTSSQTIIPWSPSIGLQHLMLSVIGNFLEQLSVRSIISHITQLNTMNAERVATTSYLLESRLQFFSVFIEEVSEENLGCTVVVSNNNFHLKSFHFCLCMYDHASPRIINSWKRIRIDLPWPVFESCRVSHWFLEPTRPGLCQYNR